MIDQDEKAFANLPGDFRGRTVEGEALNQSVLHRASIETADGLAVVTNSDTINAVVAHVAQATYHTRRVVARNYDPRYRSLYEAFNIQVISSATWGAQRIEELLYGQEIRTVYSAGNGEIELYEFSIPAGWNGKKLGGLLPDQGCCPTALTRTGRAIIPGPDTVFQPGDVLLLSATQEAAEAVRKQLESLQEA